MTVIKSKRFERVIHWGMGETRWNEETQFPPLRGTMYRKTESLAAANVKRFQRATKDALNSPSGLVRKGEADLEPSLSASSKRVQKAKAPKWRPADFTGLTKARKHDDKSWHNASGFKAVKEDIGARQRKLDKIRKERGIGQHENHTSGTNKAPKLARKLVRVATAGVATASDVSDLFNGQFQAVVNALTDAGYKLSKNDVRNYTIANWDASRAGAMAKKIGDDYAVRKYNGETVILMRGTVDIPVAMVNDGGTLYQNTVKGSHMVQEQVLKQSTSSPGTNDVSHHGMYISRLLTNPDALNEYLVKNGLMELQENPHVTLAYSREPFSVSKPSCSTLSCTGGRLGILGKEDGPKHLVLHLDGADALQSRWADFRSMGAQWDFPDFSPHVTIAKLEPGQTVDCSKYPAFKGELTFGPENLHELKDD